MLNPFLYTVYNFYQMCLKYNTIFLFEKQALILLLQVIGVQKNYVPKKKYFHPLFSILTLYYQSMIV